MLEFKRLDPNALLAMKAQRSQQTSLGMPGDVDLAMANNLADQPEAWMAGRRNGDTIACFGISETFPGVQGVAWALLADGIGSDHLELTRFVRKVVDECGLQRLELLAKAAEIEETRGFFKECGAPTEGDALVQAVMTDPTPECRWAVALGFEPAHVLRKFGAASETYMLFERIAE